MKIECPKCGATGTIPDAPDPKPLRCRKCGEKFRPQPTTFVPSEPVKQQFEDFADFIEPDPIYDPDTRSGKPSTQTMISVGVTGLLLAILALTFVVPLAMDGFKTNNQPGAGRGPGLPARPAAPGSNLLVFDGDGLNTILSLVVGAGIVSLSLLLYFLPTIIAFKRGHQNKAPILALNFLLGWAFVGWVGALVWALIEVRSRDNYHFHSYGNDGHPPRA